VSAAAAACAPGSAGTRRDGSPGRRSRAAPGLMMLAAATVLASCRAPAPEAPPRAAPPTVRVGIAVDTPQVTVASTAGLEILTAAGVQLARAGAAETWTFREEAGRITGHAARTGTRIGPADGPLVVRPSGGGMISIHEQPYRGAVLIRPARSGRLTAVNVLDMEDYLLGVVPAEIPPWELEAVKAQAVAARTYAMGHMGRREALGFDFFATVQDQVYGGVAREDTLVSRAVRETRGEVLTHEGAPILAYYHSTCGGHTASIEEVWRSEPRAYLRGVPDLVPGTDRAYCEISNRYRWTERWTRAEALETLSRTLAEHAGRPATALSSLGQISLEGRTRSGRAEQLRVVTNGRTHLVRGDSIRWVLRPAPNRILNSTYRLELESAGSGLVVRGGGWGHGIGMCQMGAIGRARAGQDYRLILSTYYRETQLVRLY
jgi:stage II sporulation protein D